MSREYPLSYTAPTTPAATDFWTQGGSAVLAPPMPTAPAAGMSSPSASASGKLSILTRVHRLLRGRYPLAITLAACGAIAGGIAGYAAVAPRYAAVGLVTIDPRIITTTVNNWNIDHLDTVLANEMGYMTGNDVAEQAMADKAYVDAYRAAYPTQPLPDATTFITGITVERPHNTTLITFTYSDKSSRVAEAAATAVLRAYQAKYGTSDEIIGHKDKVPYDRIRLADIDAKIAAATADLQAQTSKVGGDEQLTERINHLTKQSFDDETALRTMTQAYQDALAADAAGRGGNNAEKVYAEIAATGDRRMQAALDARFTAQADLDNLKARGELPGHPAYQQGQMAVAEANKRVEEYARQFEAGNPNAIATPLDANGKSSLDVQKTRIDRLTATVQKEKDESDMLAVARQNIALITGNLVALRDEHKAIQNTIDTLEDQEKLSKVITIALPGEALMQNDRRKAVAAALFVLGGFLPVGIMMLYGMGDSRFRYSDETTEADLAGVALLGILPNLPDRLSDPQQAGIAAHCVHQIRTMLQISRANDEPQVLAVTSASTGDGKTSLTLALGLSYAACGARTLLVDCDLLAAGLTHRLNVSSPDGILEAVANRALLEYVRTTDIADVAILPVGTTHAHHASTLSPVALRRLLSEAKKQFDIVIVDTGPILASIEASLICAAADRTILAVARNQQRPLVERSIGHLQAIGANLAGVVFNRAQAKDFEKSMSGLALRSRPAAGNPAAGGNTANGQSVAKAVAGSFKRAG